MYISERILFKGLKSKSDKKSKSLLDREWSTPQYVIVASAVFLCLMLMVAALVS